MAVRDAWCGAVSGGNGAVASLPAPRVSESAAPDASHRAIQGDVTALFDELRAPVLRYLLSMGLAVTDSEDVVQETFLALFRHLRLGRPRTNLRGWIFRTAHNLGLKARRLSGRERRRSSAPSAAAPLPDGRPDPEQQLSMRQRYDRMRLAANALSARDRNCLYLRAEGLRYREIAQVLGVSIGTVSNCMRRVSIRLQNAQK